MLYQILHANNGLPSDAIVCFANTGKEEEATLKFVNDCSVNWGVPIHWIEYRNDEIGFKEVNYETASKDGEPFAAMLEKKQYLPSPVMRFCTIELKIRTIHKYLKSLGLDDVCEHLNDAKHKFRKQKLEKICSKLEKK